MEGQGTGNECGNDRDICCLEYFNLMAEIGKDRIKFSWEEIMYSAYSFFLHSSYSNVHKKATWSK